MNSSSTGNGKAKNLMSLDRTGFSPILAVVSLILFFGFSGDTCHAATGSPTVRVGSEVDFPPYAFVDESGQPTGFSVDLIKAVSASMGLLIEINTGPWDMVWNDLAAGRLDLLPIVAKSLERHRVADFSLPHTETFDAFFVRKGSPLIPNIEAGKGKEIVVMRSDAAHHELMARKFEGCLIPVDTIPAGLSLVASGKHDAFLCSKLIGTIVIKEHGLKGLTSGPAIPDYTRVFSFAVKEGDSELLEKLNQGLLIIKTNGEYERIYEKWLTADDPWLRLKKYLMPAVAGLTTSALILCFWLLVLRREVKKRTQELAKSNEMLRQAGGRLEERVTQRTAELEQVNALLQQEVSERKRAEVMLQEERDRLAALVSSIRDEIWFANAAGQFTLVNPSAAREFRLEADASLDARQLATDLEVFHPDGMPRPVEDAPPLRALGGEVVTNQEEVIRTPASGELRYRQVSAAPVYNVSGQIIGSVSVVRDITEIKQAEEALRVSEERFRTLYASMNEGVAIHELVYEKDSIVDYKIIDVNPAYESITGLGRSLAVGRKASELYGTREAPYLSIYGGVASTGEPVTFETYFPPMKRHFSISVFSPGKGKFATVFQDITERKQVEEALRESEARFRLLSQTAARLLEAEDPLKVVSDLAAAVMAHLDCQAFFNFVVHEESGRLHLNAYAGIPEEEACNIEWLDYGVAVCGCVARDGVRIVAEEICSTADPRTDLVKSYGILAYACHPLLAAGRVIGTLSFGAKTRESFSPQDLDLMKTVADQVAVAMERMRLLKEVERSRDELETRVAVRTVELAEANTQLQETASALMDSEERLRRNNELLQKIFDGISDPLVMLNQSGLVTMINKAAMEYYGVGLDVEICNKPCFQGLRGRDTACPECHYPFLSVGTRTMSFERDGIHGHGRVESVTVYPVPGEDGQRDAVIVRISDITQAKILERQILQNEKLAALGLVTSGIAHEINNPNSFIYFNLPILRSYLEELMPIVDEHAAHDPDFEVLNMPYGELREDIFRLLENMEHGSQRISKIIGVLKSFVRKRDQEGVQRVDLKEIVKKVVALCHTDLRQKLSSFEIMVQDNLPSIVSDPEAIEQVLMNLLINAIQACDKPDSRVSLKVEHEVGGMGGFILEITDNGPGIEETVRERIFDPFFTTKSPNQGTGLGLYICHSHVTSLGGRIEVESKIGEGTIFRVVLPEKCPHGMEGTLQAQA